MRFRVLGPLEVRTDDDVPVKVPESKVRLLLAILLSHDGRPVPVDALAEHLWGSAQPKDPAAVLRTKVAQLRRALESAEPGGRDLVEWRAGGYALRAAAGAVDARAFAALAARARAGADPQARAALLADALELWRGEPYAGFSAEPCLQGAIAQLAEQRLAAIEERAEAELELGRPAEVLDELAEQVRRHPLRERLRACHMRALYQAGRQGEALADYHDLRVRLADELGVDPSPAVAAVHQAILRQDAALEPARPRTDLPVPLTELIGRDEEIARVAELVHAGRLVTLTGPGGVGKTRLAVAVADRLAAAFPGGVHLVELAALDHPAHTGAPPAPADVATLIAATLGLTRATGPGSRGQPVPPTDRIVTAVRERRTLLVLDNCEHVVEPVAEIAGRLLAGAPGLRVLATGREPLGLSGERLHVVAPLAVPERDAPLAGIAGADAVRLFTARAAAAGGFVLDETTAPAAAAICRRLDGLPLALELAAARVRSLGVAEVARRLDSRFRLLTQGRRDAPARQRTLRAVIDWSWELLTEPERVALCRLALHPGGCTLDAAEAVCATGGIAGEEVMDVLARLVDRSLLVVAGHRYRLADSVAAYCVERLTESGDLAAARSRHAAYYTELAERADAHVRGPDQERWLALLDAETVNLRGVLDDAVQSGDGAAALRLATALAWYWMLRGRLEEAHRAFTHALPLASTGTGRAWHAALSVMTGHDAATMSGDPPPTDEPMALWVLGSSLFGSGDLPGSERLTRRALAAFEARGDEWGVAAARNTLAWHHLARGRSAAAEGDARLSLAAFDRLGDPWGQMLAVESLAAAAEATGHYRRAAGLYERSLGIAERLGLAAEIPFKLCGLADVHLSTGEHEQAGRLYERARRLAARESVRLAETYALIGLGRVARLAGRLEAADEHLRAVLERHRRHGHEPGIAAAAMTELALTTHARGHAEDALTLHDQACRAARAGGDPRTLARALEGRAGTLAHLGDHRAAARLLDRAAEVRAAVPLSPADREAVERTTAAVRAALGPATS
ncbi:BTAD domain-containing putative transcriptional regulator [Nonomuraea sp. NPDC023979]|uniref:AfsR/SARP family transcriptional regulator n=1 Tax=Nonomuraea sp. NPDC023979 TaxID=3154796 RepID=UPI0033F6F339